MLHADFNDALRLMFHPGLPMLSVRIQGQTYRISKDTLDRLIGADNWGRMDSGLLQNRIRDEHRDGRLIETSGRRLRLATSTEHAERRLRSEKDPGEVLRWGLLYVASQVAEVAEQLRALHSQFDNEAATTSLSRDTLQESFRTSSGAQPS